MARRSNRSRSSSVLSTELMSPPSKNMNRKVFSELMGFSPDLRKILSKLPRIEPITKFHPNCPYISISRFGYTWKSWYPCNLVESSVIRSLDVTQLDYKRQLKCETPQLCAPLASHNNLHLGKFSSMSYFG